MPDRLNLQPGQITIRHVRLRQTADPVSPDGAVTVLGKTYVPSRAGINGARGFVSGVYERRLNDSGSFTLRFPNAAGDDGVLHRNRFLILQRGRRVPVAATSAPTSAFEPGTFYTVSGGNYRPGDEWIEIYRERDLLYVGTPTRAQIAQDVIEIAGEDAWWLLRKVRATAADFWSHAPRDVIEHYTSAWATVVGEDFGPSGPAISNATGTDVQTAETIGGVSYNRLDTRWATMPGTGVLRLQPTATAGALGRVRSVAAFPFGLGATAPDRFQGWRLDAVVYLPAFGDTVDCGVYDYSVPGGCFISIGATGAVSLVSYGWTTKTIKPLAVPGRHALAVEGRGRWVYYYIDGALVGIMPMPTANLSGRAFVALTYSSGTPAYVDVDSLLMRRTQPFLLRGATGGGTATPGSYRLPGAPPSGGLVGTYYSDMDLSSDANRGGLLLNPTRSPYARRQDATVNFTGTTWQPTGSGATYFSVRWTGAIYLDLAATDYLVKVGVGGTADSFRLWIGKTRWGEQYATVDNVAGASLRTHLGGSVSGWYPVVLEVVYGTGTPPTVNLNYSTNGGSTYAVVPSTALSPLGVFQQQVRYESHYDALQGVLEAHGLQAKVQAQPLESGLFPGQIVPRVREGRDTEKIIDFVEATEIAVAINAEEVADSLFADAQGLADPRQAAQLTLEGQNFARLEAPGLPELERHVLVASEYDTLSEITIQAVAQTRLNSLLALRGSAWENATARPAGTREYLDAFPLAGAPAEFAWEPGDGVRLWLGEISVEDASPRQILGVQREFVGDGLRRPSVSFRQRPRDLATLLRSIQRDVVQHQRYYQGQFAVVSGGIGGNTTGSFDVFSRVPLPADLDAVVNATWVVQYKSDASAWTITVNSVSTGRTLTGVGRYDITPWLARRADAPGSPGFFVSMTGGSGTWEATTELIVRV